MKKIKIIYGVLLIILFSSTVTAQISKAEIRATGLTCSMCSNAINKQLKSLTDVVEVQTDLNTNTFTVTLKEGNILNPKIFKEQVEKAGFFIGSLVLTTKLNTLKQSNYVLVNEDTTKNSNDIQIQVLDKGYVTDKEFKKLSKSLKNIATYTANNEDDFHIKIIN